MPTTTNQIKNLKGSLGTSNFAPVISRFLDYITVEAGLSENTILAYGRDLMQFAQYCHKRGIKSPDVIDIKTITGYMKQMTDDGKVEASINRSLVAIKMFLRWSISNGHIKRDFTMLLEGPKLWQKLPVVCSKEQVIKLLAAPDPKEPYFLRDKAMLELLYATGARVSEVAGLDISNLNLKIGYVRVLGKGRKERIIPLGKIAMQTISSYIENQRTKLAKPFSGDALFLSRTGRRLCRIQIWRLVKTYARRAGMGRNLTVHTLRHCFASHLLAGGADLRSVQEMLGHANVATTQIYTHVDTERLRAIHKKFHPRQ